MIVLEQGLLLIIFTLSRINYVESARILCAFQMAAVSHHQVFQPIWKELSLRGHQVVVVTPYPLKEPGKKKAYLKIITEQLHICFSIV